MSAVKGSMAKAYAPWFKIGAAINHRTLVSHADLIRQHFNSMTAENEMKFESLHARPEGFDFSRPDKVLDFARQNAIAIRGHTLVWHNQTPTAGRAIGHDAQSHSYGNGSILWLNLLLGCG